MLEYRGKIFVKMDVTQMYRVKLEGPVYDHFSSESMPDQTGWIG